MAATRWYVTNSAAPYSPATFKGGWEATGAAVSVALAPTKAGAQTSVAVSESSTSNTFDSCCVRAVSGPLAAQSIAGTLDVLLIVNEGASGDNFGWYVHAWVTQGDSDTARGTLLADYFEAANGSWTLSGVGRALPAPQSLSSVAAQAGDRLVVEIGFRAHNTSGTARTGTVKYGGTGADLTAGGSGTTAAGFVDFSQSILEAADAASGRRPSPTWAGL